MALSDPGGILASPLTIFERGDEEQAIRAITDIIEQYQVGRIVVGLPRSMNGSIGIQAEKVQAFVEELRRYTQVPVEFRDERLTTVSAQRLMRIANPKKKRKARDDAVAAALILQGYLDETQNNRRLY